jgi:uncharacterized phage-like protein YoqJ
MPVCCFGNSEIYNRKEIEEKLKETLIYCIEEKKFTEFHVGNYGDFDFLCAKCLKELKNSYPFIKSYCILAYLKPKMSEYEEDYYKTYFDGTIYLDLENTPLKLAITKRNKIMLNYADYIIFGVNNIGNSCNLLEMAKRKHKNFINIGDYKV